jgi:tRNA nucleotidyltransferase/poly(A) polymerase
MPNKLSIKWFDDLENVLFEVQKSGLSNREWASRIDLSEPIDVSFEKNKFYIEDGHHRYYAAKILNKPLNVNLEIKSNPIIKLGGDLGYDEFHRVVWNMVHDKKNINEVELMSLDDLPFKKEVEQLGGKIFSVGGAVRDKFLGKDSKDLDILITGIPMDKLEQLLSKYGRVDAVGKSFGVLKFKPQGSSEDIDIAIPRTERATGEGGHKGFDVTSDHALPIEKDLERRDFTINAIAKDIDGNIIDPYGGQEDLKNKIIRVVNPEAFSDDPLRMLRAVQFASRFGFRIEPKTMQLIQENSARIKEIPAERILTEFDKILKKGNKRIGVQLLKDTGLFKNIFGFDIKQSSIDRNPFDEVQSMGEFILLLTKLLSNPAEFYKNNLKGDIDTYKEIRALQLAFEHSEETDLPVARSIAHNMYVYSPKSIESKILPSVIETAAQELLAGKYPKTISELAVNGNDLMQLGLQGKAIGDTLKSLLFKVYSNQIKNDKNELISTIGNKSLNEDDEKVDNIEYGV